LGNNLEGNRLVEIRPPKSAGVVRVYFHLEHRGNPANHLPSLLPEKRIRFNTNPARIADRIIHFFKHQNAPAKPDVFVLLKINSLCYIIIEQ